MNQLRSHWMVAGLAALVGALAALLAVECLHKAGPREAFGQEPAASANSVLALMGPTVSDATPIVVVDTKAQTIMVYEYMVSRKVMYLRCVRTYAFDKELPERYFFNSNAYEGPSVPLVRDLLRSPR